MEEINSYPLDGAKYLQDAPISGGTSWKLICHRRLKSVEHFISFSVFD